MIKAIFFDLFETLLTEHGNTKLSAMEIARFLNISADDYSEITGSIREDRYRGKYPKFEDVLLLLCEKTNIPVDMKLFKEISFRRETLKSKCFENIDDEIIEILSLLKNQNIKLVLISNVSCEEISGFSNSSLAKYFDYTMFSCEVGLIKPEPEIYLEACKKVDIRPDACIFIGDGGSNELCGAKNVGIIPYCANWYLAKHNYSPPAGYKLLNYPKEIMKII